MARPVENALDRFWSKVNYLGKWSLIRGEWSQCWEWTGGLDGSGYGAIHIDGHKKGAHRWIYEQIHGPITPSNLETDHLCRNRKCVRDSHLEIVTRRENIVRGIGPTALNAAKDTCDLGHPFTQDETRNGQRYCRICDLEAKRENYRLNRDKYLALEKERRPGKSKARWEKIKADPIQRAERNLKKKEAWAKLYSTPEYKEKRNRKYAQQKALNS